MLQPVVSYLIPCHDTKKRLAMSRYIVLELHTPPDPFIYSVQIQRAASRPDVYHTPLLQTESVLPGISDSFPARRLRPPDAA